MSYDQYRSAYKGSIPPAKIVAWIKENFDFKTRKNGIEYCINSPFNNDRGYNFNINPDKNSCHDWRGDEWAGPINPETNRRNCSFLKFVRLYRKCSYAEALTEVMGTAVDIRYFLKPQNRVTDNSAKRIIEVAMPEGAEPLSTSNDKQSKSLKKWLASRGYSEEDILKNDLNHLGMDVYWPYYEFDTLVYWQSRSRLNKRFNFPSLDVYDKTGAVVGQVDGTKGDFLYGFDDIEPASYVIITEAIFDKHVLRQQVLASGGAILTSKQISKLKILGPKEGIILSPDNDKAGIESIITNYQLLSNRGFDVFYSIPPKLEYTKDDKTEFTKDWNEIGQFITGFDKVREIHDLNIRKVNEIELFKLYEMVPVK